jgi:hypothetical protein
MAITSQMGREYHTARNPTCGSSAHTFHRHDRVSGSHPKASWIAMAPAMPMPTVVEIGTAKKAR